MTLSELEHLRCREQAQFDTETSREERNRSGLFATPNRLAVEMTTYLSGLLDSTEQIRFLEPALGSGVFYSAVLQTIGPERIRSAVAFETDPRLVELSRRLWESHGLEVIEGDFTRLYQRTHAANLVLTNPPYVRHHHLDQPTKQRLRGAAQNAAGVTISGLAGLYAYFMLIAHHAMSEGAVAGWLVPSELMSVKYGAAVREYLTNRVRLLRVHTFDPADAQFDEALVSSAVVVYRKSPPGGMPPLFTSGGTLLHPAEGKRSPLGSLRRRKWAPLPRAPLSASRSVAIGDLFDVRRGLVTGANSFFVMNRKHARHLGLPSEFLRPVLPKPRRLACDVLTSGPDGHPLVDPQLVLLDCNLPEDQVEARFPPLWEYLQEGIAQGLRRRYLLSRRSPWYRQEHRPAAPFLCNYMGRGKGAESPFRFVWNQSHATATNAYLMLYPKGLLAAVMKEPGISERVHRALRDLPGSELRHAGRVYGGGLYKIEPRELERVPAATVTASIPEIAQ